MPTVNGRRSLLPVVPVYLELVKFKKLAVKKEKWVGSWGTVFKQAAKDVYIFVKS